MYGVSPASRKLALLIPVAGRCSSIAFGPSARFTTVFWYPSTSTGPSSGWVCRPMYTIVPENSAGAAETHMSDPVHLDAADHGVDAQAQQRSRVPADVAFFDLPGTDDGGAADLDPDTGRDPHLHRPDHRADGELHLGCGQLGTAQVQLH